MAKRYLDPKIDFAFKRVFGEHANLLKSFLNALLPLPEDALIESLEYLQPEQAPDLPGLLKNSIVDVKCVDAKGRIFIVEMQMLWRPSFESRIVFGASQAYVRQLKAGQNYTALQPVYALALINDVFDHKTPEYYHHYRIVSEGDPARTLKGLEFVLIEIPKFKPESRTARRMEVKWLRFMSEIGQGCQPPDEQMQQDADIAQALQLVETAAFTEDELAAYEVGLDRARLEMSILDDTRAEGHQMGRAEGLEEGRAEGREQGREQGREEGKALALAQLVRTMHHNGMTAEQISAATQLPLAEVQACLGR